jgi:hypothetical protein
MNASFCLESFSLSKRGRKTGPTINGVPKF